MVISSVDDLLMRVRAWQLRQQAELDELREDTEEVIRAGLAPGASAAAQYSGQIAQARRDRRLPACR
jgi:hypothetical protein